MTVEPGRLRKALWLRAEPEPDGVWRVNGHVVTAERCDCRDHAVRGAAILCKHRLAVRLAALGPEILDGLRALVPLPPTAP